MRINNIARRRAALVAVIVGLVATACDRDVTNPQTDAQSRPVSPLVKGGQAAASTIDSPDDLTIPLSFVPNTFDGSASDGGNVNALYPYPTAVKVVATGVVAKTADYPIQTWYDVNPSGTLNFGPGNSQAYLKAQLPGGQGYANYFFGGSHTESSSTQYRAFEANTRVTGGARVGAGDPTTTGAWRKDSPNGQPWVNCGPAYGTHCFTYSGDPGSITVTRLNADIAFSVDSTEVSTGSQVTFFVRPSPLTVEGQTMYYNIDSTSWTPDPDSVGGDFSEAVTNGACTISGGNCTRTMKGSGTIRIVAHINGKGFVVTQHVQVRDAFPILTASKAVAYKYAQPSDSILFTTHMSDGSVPNMWDRQWIPDTSPATSGWQCGYWQTTCNMAVRESGTMVVTVIYKGQFKKARAHVEIQRRRLQVDGYSAVPVGDTATYTASGSGGTVVIQNWLWSPQGSAPLSGLRSIQPSNLLGSTAGQAGCSQTATQCTDEVQVPGRIIAVGTVDGVADTASLDISVFAVPQPGDDVGPETGEDCALDGEEPLALLLSPLSLPIPSALGGPFLAEGDEASDEFCDALLNECYRQATKAESDSILAKAIASGEWSYTQGGAKGGNEPAKDVSNRVGDCTDFTWASVKTALGSSWPQPYYKRPGTANFGSWTATQLQSVGYVRLQDADSARAGDIVVRGGHAGVFIEKDANGRIWGHANNGTPAKPGIKRGDSPTGTYDFTGVGTYVPQFFRPLIPVPCSPSDQ